MSNLDKLMADLLFQYEEQEFENIDSMQDIPIPSELDNRIQALIRHHSSPEKSKKQNLSVLRKAAIVFLVLGITLGSVLAFSPKARALVKDIIKIFYSDHNSYRFGTEYVEIHKGDYTLGYIPEGFELLEEGEVVSGFYQYYNGENESRLDFYYYSAQAGTIAIDNENMEHKDIKINGLEGVIAHDTESLFTSAFLLDEGVVLEITGDFEYDTAIKILENIQKNRL
ncbi:MAG: DUF4367 domain-containing protein [Peptostreptococcaceae bacterium]|nr:DUF4367 domain-containing protein [Peptostreptococcaceae bacterium]